MNDAQIAKVKQFMNDSIMSEVIYNSLMDSFLKERPQQDVHTLAASRLSIDFLKQGWKELEKYTAEHEKEEKVMGNVGL